MQNRITIQSTIPLGAIELPRDVQSMQAIREARDSGLPNFAAALAYDLRTEMETREAIARLSGKAQRRASGAAQQ